MTSLTQRWARFKAARNAALPLFNRTMPAWGELLDGLDATRQELLGETVRDNSGAHVLVALQSYAIHVVNWTSHQFLTSWQHWIFYTRYYRLVRYIQCEAWSESGLSSADRYKIWDQNHEQFNTLLKEQGGTLLAPPLLGAGADDFEHTSIGCFYKLLCLVVYPPYEQQAGRTEEEVDDPNCDRAAEAVYPLVWRYTTSVQHAMADTFEAAGFTPLLELRGFVDGRMIGPDDFSRVMQNISQKVSAD